MTRNKPKMRLKRLSTALLLCLYAPFSPAQNTDLAQASAAAFEQAWLPVYPQVSVNGSLRDGMDPFLSRNGLLYARADVLRAYGIVLPSETEAAAQSQGVMPDTADNRGVWFDLSAVAGLQSEYDAAAQTLKLTAPLEWQPDLKTMRFGAPVQQPYHVARPGFAAVLNYDANTSHNNSGSSTQGVFGELRLTSPWGYLTHTHFANQNRASDGRTVRSQARLDTYWHTVWPERGISLTLGDTVTGQIGSWGGTRIGGIKISHSYAVQPWRQTAPLRAYLGRSTLPATVDLYLDGVKQVSRDVAAGEYELTLPPVISGRSHAQVVATDILGRTVVTDMPLYGSSSLLAKGYNEWSLEAGYVHQNYGTRDSSYRRDLAASGTLRYGLSNYLTAEIHGEAVRGYRQIGVAADTLLGSLGQLRLHHTQSSLNGEKGRRSSAFFNTQWQQVSFSAGWNRTEDAFAEMGDTAVGTLQRQHEGKVYTSVSASAGWNSAKAGSFSLSYLHAKRGGEADDSVGSLSWSSSIGKRASAYTGLSKNFGGKRETGLYAGLSVSLDKGYSLSAGAGRSDSENTYQASLTKTASGPGSVNWNIGWQRQDSDGRSSSNTNAHIRYQSTYGDGWVNAHYRKAGSNWNAGWRGALVVMQGDVFATRSVTDSFAVISTGGEADIPIISGSGAVGKTNRNGLLLVPNLSAYQKNTVSVDITDLPLDMQLESTVAEIVPAARSGMQVEFKIRRTLSATLTLKNDDGSLLPSGGSVLDENGEAVAVTGFDGKTFIENMKTGRNRFSVMLPEDGGECRFETDYPEQHDRNTLPDLGEIICRP